MLFHQVSSIAWPKWQQDQGRTTNVSRATKTKNTADRELLTWKKAVLMRERSRGVDEQVLPDEQGCGGGDAEPVEQAETE